MAALTVRNLDEAVVRRLRIQAAENGRSAEAEHREILRSALLVIEQPLIPPEPIRRPHISPPRIVRNRPPTEAELMEEADVRRMWAASGNTASVIG
jgi:antitoxin FitA